MTTQISEDQKRLFDTRKYPIRPHVGIGALIIHKDQICLVKRKYDPDAGKWAIPGGHLELGERAEICAVREAEEETHLKVKVDCVAGIIDKIMYDMEGKIQYHYLLVNYFTPLIDPSNPENTTPKPSSDALDAKFVHVSDLKHYDLTDSLGELLKNLKLLI